MKKLQFDVLHSSPGRVLLCVMLPLLAVNGISLLTVALTYLALVVIMTAVLTKVEKRLAKK